MFNFRFGVAATSERQRGGSRELEIALPKSGDGVVLPSTEITVSAWREYSVSGSLSLKFGDGVLRLPVR